MTTDLERLTNFLRQHYPGHIDPGENAVDTAIRLLALDTAVQLLAPQPCGHPTSAIRYHDDGTHYCALCEDTP